MTRVAAIDCGTNSIRLLIADVAGGRLTDVTRQMRIVRLGQGVDRTGRLDEAALERTRQALGEYASAIRDAGAGPIRMVATSATRDAANRDAFEAMVRAELGVRPDVVTGREEAALSFAGAAGVLPAGTGPVLVTDIGGGSTELVRGDGDGALRSHSMDVGSVRMTERHLRDDPPTAAQVAAVEADVADALERAADDVPLDEPARFVGVAGTVTTVAAVALGLAEFDPVAVDGAELSADHVEEVTERLLRLDHDGRAAISAIHPGRVDVIAAGAVVLRTVMTRCGAEQLVASEHDILDGIALGLADRQRGR